jgi:hypothetical protein
MLISLFPASLKDFDTMNQIYSLSHNYYIGIICPNLFIITIHDTRCMVTMYYTKLLYVIVILPGVVLEILRNATKL